MDRFYHMPAKSGTQTKDNSKSNNGSEKLDQETIEILDKAMFARPETGKMNRLFEFSVHPTVRIFCPGYSGVECVLCRFQFISIASFSARIYRYTHNEVLLRLKSEFLR